MQIILIMQIAAENRKLNFYREPCYRQISCGLMFLRARHPRRDCQ